MRDRIDEPPFEGEDEVTIPTTDIENLSSELLDACNEVLDNLIYDYNKNLSDYDRDTLKDEVLITLKHKING
tara:strand:+ start:35 stop:250 length:216 start_codon:yes stop_codon:yes gene_type:complete